MGDTPKRVGGPPFPVMSGVALTANMLQSSTVLNRELSGMPEAVLQHRLSTIAGNRLERADHHVFVFISHLTVPATDHEELERHFRERSRLDEIVHARVGADGAGAVSRCIRARLAALPASQPG